MPSKVSMSGADHIRRQTLEELERELAEAREQQTATAQILAAISSSPTEAHHVFAQIAASAARLCDASNAGVLQVHGDHLRLVAHHGPIPADPIGQGRTPLTRGALTGRAVIERRTIQVADLQTETKEYPEGSEFARRLGYHTIVAVPLIRVEEAVGAILIRRTEVRPFTDRQIDLLKTFADQAVIAIENTRLFEAEQASKRELRESLEYQTAISEVLAVISRSPSDLKPVLKVIVDTAARLCQADKANIRRKEGAGYRTVASIGFAQTQRDFIEQTAVQLDRTTIGGRVALGRETVHIADVLEDRDLRTDILSGINFRTGLGVPLLRKGELIGLLLLAREKQHPFSRRQIELVETFADQAVIAIENTRLFEEVQARTKELQASLDRQTATAEVLGVISSSPSQTQPVFEAIVATAARLCRAEYALIFKRESDERYHVAAANNAEAEWLRFSADNPIPPGRGSLVGRTALEGSVVHISDCLADPEFTLHAYQRVYKFRTMLGVPLLRRGSPAGVIALLRNAVAPFSDAEIDLVTIFADQAVIAIENTRLFEAEQASKRELQESLEYQTATSEVLGAISRTPTELQPVLAEICKTANRLCETPDAAIFLEDGEWLRLGSVQGSIGAGSTDKIALTRDFVAGRAFLDREVVHVHDLRAVAGEYPEAYESSLKLGHRTIIGVPLICNEDAIGVLILRRSEVKPFTDKEVQVLKTFADQAVIAIENARLFEAEQARTREVTERTRELTEALEQQTATADVLKVISRSALDLQRVLDALVESAAQLCNAYDAVIFQMFGDGLRLVAHHGQIPTARPVGQYTLPLVRGLITGRAFIDRRAIQVADMLTEADDYPESRAVAEGWRTALAVPLVHAGEAIGVILIRRAEVRPFTERQIELVNTFADQAVIAIENTRLFNEIAQKSRELEIASQHKSQFVANMSHELRTPLAAILGYAELMQEGFYEPQGPKSLDALTRIRSNGKHLLGLINMVLDIAKIESGQFSLNLAEYTMDNIVETVRAATESLAETKKLSLNMEVAKSLPVGLGDEQRLTQVLLNLVGNAIKFTDAGEVRITAGARDGHFAVSVTDTGPGIPLDQRDRIFEQFHQVDSSNTKAKGGTGLGLAIAKQIVEMHGGRIWVESTLGKGSTFQMELPTRAQFHKRTP